MLTWGWYHSVLILNLNLFSPSWHSFKYLSDIIIIFQFSDQTATLSFICVVWTKQCSSQVVAYKVLLSLCREATGIRLLYAQEDLNLYLNIQYWFFFWWLVNIRHPWDVEAFTVFSFKLVKVLNLDLISSNLMD